MNFNLISPSSNGNEYTINFKDPIKIGANSKLELNWAEFMRKGEIIIEDDQTIDFTCDNNLPTHIPGTPATANSFVLQVGIPRGKYELTEFQDLIEQLTNQEINNKKELLNYKSATVDNNNGNFGSGLQDDGKIGLVLETTTYGLFNFDGTNEHDGQTATSGGNVVSYTTANNTGTYDNYANSDTHFDFYRANCPKNQGEQNSFAHFKSINRIDAQTGKIFFGLIGKEYTDGIGGAPPTRTHGNNPPVLHNGVPAAFVGVDCGDSTGDLVIYVAKNSGGNTIDTWNDQNQEIAGMHVVQRIPVATFNTSQAYDLLFGTEIDNTTASPSIRWKIANYQGGAYNEIYDSKPNRMNLPFKLLVGDTTVYNNALALNSQIPFGLQVSATNADEGWDDISYTELDKTESGASDAEPISIVRDYKILLSQELADIFSTVATVSNLYPNGCQDAATLIDTNLDVNWKSQNYSIFINLPTNNYKNVAEKKDGGFKKSILGNIPAPFTTGAINTKQGADTGDVVATYQPYNPIVSDLKNNEIQTNTLEIKIVDMLTEKPATEINRSIVNFTIKEN
mgnify:CR=1 FL=1|jgi:hypothetical protein